MLTYRGYARRDQMRRRIRTGPLVGFVGLLALLAVLAATVGLGAAGWAVGFACGASLAVLLTRAMARQDRLALWPADRVTLVRAVLTCGVAALTADWLGSHPGPKALVALAAVAMLLDGIDGRVARWTATTSEFGARFDFEVDAFLILVLSVFVAAEWGWWVLVLGGARYLYVAAGWVLPWLHGSPPPRRWARVVAVVVGVALLVAAAGVLPDPATLLLLLVAVGLLAESFGRSVWQLWRLHGGRPFPRAAVTAGLALLLVWSALLVPDRWDELTPGAFLRIPVEGLIFVAVALLLPSRGALILALLGGLSVAVLTILRVLDMGFQMVFELPFHPVYDTAYAGSAMGLLRDSIGQVGAVTAVAVAGLLVVGLLLLLPLSAVRLTRLVARHRRPSIRILAALAAIAIVATVSGNQFGPAATIASTASARLAYSHATQVRDDLRDQREFARTLEQADPAAHAPEDGALTSLRGKDVLLVFIESYGRIASDIPIVRSALGAAQRRLDQAGLSSRSGWLTSPTFGGGSWLAHITLQSGLWVDNQQRYDRALTLDRVTLTDEFGRAGWRTVLAAPANDDDWPPATTFYHYDKVYDARTLGYAGPRFGWARMPDQYTLAAFQRLELDQPNRPPIMAEINLVSSHWPWTPLPHLIDWNLVGDGSVFDPMTDESEYPPSKRQDAQLVRAAYGKSIAYSLETLTSWLQRLNDPNLVLVVLGDHQPNSLVSGEGASRNVPVSIIASDPSVTEGAAAWGWQPGLQPNQQAPVWPMDAFRDRFLTTYAPAESPATTVVTHPRPAP